MFWKPSPLCSVALFSVLAAFVQAVCCFDARAQHAHIAAGAETPTQGSKLFFVNGNSFVTNSGYVLYLDDKDPLYPGLYQNATTFTALPATLWTGGPTPYAAEQGSYLELEMFSVKGPSGGMIGVWEENEDASATTMKFSVAAGTTNSTNRFNLSEGIEDPDPDPFGHIHGRRFTANKPGLYTVGFRILDTSQAGANRGPIHVPSAPFYMYFQAGLTISSLTRTNNLVTAVFGTQPFMTYFLEAANSLAETNWITVAGPTGDRHSDLHTLTDTNAIGSARFYRLRAQAP